MKYSLRYTKNHVLQNKPNGLTPVRWFANDHTQPVLSVYLIQGFCSSYLSRGLSITLPQTFNIRLQWTPRGALSTAWEDVNTPRLLLCYKPVQRRRAATKGLRYQQTKLFCYTIVCFSCLDTFTKDPCLAGNTYQPCVKYPRMHFAYLRLGNK